MKSTHPPPFFPFFPLSIAFENSGQWRLVRSMIILGTLVYLQFTITALSGVSCSREGDGTLRLNAELRTPCYQGAHLPVALLTWVLIFGPLAIDWLFLFFFFSPLFSACCCSSHRCRHSAYRLTHQLANSLNRPT